jgi:hypothetical protein
MTNEMLMRNVLTAAQRQARFGLEFASRADPVRAREYNTVSNTAK